LYKNEKKITFHFGLPHCQEKTCSYSLAAYCSTACWLVGVQCCKKRYPTRYRSVYLHGGNELHPTNYVSLSFL